MTEINFLVENVDMPPIDRLALAGWIEAVAHSFNKNVGSLSYIFCNDDYILEANRRFLGHDYYTDIITFDYSNSRRIAGDMLISLDTVASNAQMLGVDYNSELLRVLIHGVLHLCGVNDKGVGEREIMEHHENAALAIAPATILKK